MEGERSVAIFNCFASPKCTQTYFQLKLPFNRYSILFSSQSVPAALGREDERRRCGTDFFVVVGGVSELAVMFLKKRKVHNS
jgi:hypothetical protein